MECIGEQLYSRGEWAAALRFFEQKMSLGTAGTHTDRSSDEKCRADLQKLAGSCRLHIAAERGCPVSQTLATSDLYAIAGVPRDAVDVSACCRQRFRAKALRVHPDKTAHAHGHDAFRRLQFAADVLRNPESRARYDAGGMEALRELAGRRPSLGYDLWAELTLQEREEARLRPAEKHLPPLQPTPSPVRPRRVPSATSTRRRASVPPRAARATTQQKLRGVVQAARGLNAIAAVLEREEHKRAVINDREFESVLSSLREQRAQATSYRIQADMSRESCDPLKQSAE